MTKVCRGCGYEDMKPITDETPEPVRISRRNGYCELCHFDSIPEEHETRAVIAGLEAEVARMQETLKYIQQDIGLIRDSGLPMHPDIAHQLIAMHIRINLALKPQAALEEPK